MIFLQILYEIFLTQKELCDADQIFIFVFM